jgi:hypothetical protein
MPANYKDGATGPSGVPGGKVSINSVDYVVRSWTSTQGSSKVEDLNEDGAPSQKAHFAETLTGSAVLQLATADTARPPLFTEFEGPDDADYVVTEVGETRGIRDMATFSITFEAILNPSA